MPFPQLQRYCNYYLYPPTIHYYYTTELKHKPLLHLYYYFSCYCYFYYSTGVGGLESDWRWGPATLLKRFQSDLSLNFLVKAMIFERFYNLSDIRKILQFAAHERETPLSN